jgi:RNA polymerase sigma factor (sigma-70 family)
MHLTTGPPQLEREFERLYRRHRGDVYRSVLRDVRNPDEAEDVTQITFLDAYRALQRGDEPVRPRAWLLAIAQNAARRRFRARAAGPREVELEANLLVVPDEVGPSADEIRLALGRLGARQREALVLREIAGRSYVEIAVALDLSVSAVETLLFRARRALRKELTGWEPSRRTAGLVVWPLAASPGDVLGALLGRAARLGATAKAAGAVSAVVLGTAVVLQPAAPPPPEPQSQRSAPVEQPSLLAETRLSRPERERAQAPTRAAGPAKKRLAGARAAAPRSPAGSEAPLVETPPLAVGPVAVPAVQVELPDVAEIVTGPLPAVVDAVDAAPPVPELPPPVDEPVP